MASLLPSVGLADLVGFDPRPTFIVALSSSEQPFAALVYRNRALEAVPTLDQAVQSIPHDESHACFWRWITTNQSMLDGDTGAASSAQHSLPYLGITWTRTLVQGQWAVMSANEAFPPSDLPRKVRIEDRDGVLTVNRIQSPVATRDSAVAPGQSSASKTPMTYRADSGPGLMVPVFDSEPEPFLDVVHGLDWDSTPLGPMASWPAQLTQTFNQVISDSRPIAIFWGPDYITIYNEAFSRFCGTRHPALLGGPAAEAWPHFKERLDSMSASPLKNYSKVEDESRLFLEQADGSFEEMYAKRSMVPIVSDKKCLGVQLSLQETTSKRLWERRMKMLIELGDRLVSARDAQSYWTETIEELERWTPSYDVPLAFIYSVRETDDGTSSAFKYGCSKVCRLEGSLGVPEKHPIAPQTLDLRSSDKGLASTFRECIKSTQPLLLQTKDNSLPLELLGGLEWRGFGDPCRAAILCPIRPTKGENVMGILFLGLNPRRPYDHDYRQFTALLNQKLTSSLASTVLFEEEARGRRNVTEKAAHDNAMLQERLEYQTEQVNRSVQTFKAVAEFIPVGMCFSDTDLHVTFANDAWHRITGHTNGPISQNALLEGVIDEDRARVTQAYEDVKECDVVTFEYRIAQREADHPHRKHHEATVEPQDRSVRHILASTKAERAADGTVVRFLTCLTDVTVQKDTAEEAIRRAQESENLKRLAEFAPVGMYNMSNDGHLLSANNLFWELTGLTKVDLTKHVVKPWPECVVQEDLPALEQGLEQLQESGRSQTVEFRLVTPWETEEGNDHGAVTHRWVMGTFMPVKSSEGVVQSYTGCLSDVSRQKWQLEQEKHRKEEAIESRRQQENFIDMTSHEMRNPLSAMLHCTDAIIASLSRVQDFVDNPALPPTPTLLEANAEEQRPSVAKRSEEEIRLLKDSIENAETIVTCAQHQKRIVDDILTMSKLDSKLLAVTPCTVDPIEIVSDALKMFEVEARRVDIELTSFVDKSFTDLGHDYLDLDPSRVKQVLINLLTNALKFTKCGKTRNVAIFVKASLEPPGKSMTTVNFIPRFCDISEEYDQPALRGRSNPVYLLFEVKDTGQGLSELERGNLFNKFVQASAKTHTKYGGSGLGLFISRRLTELQNGAIGVSSTAGVGSTFAFYIEAYVPSEEALTEVRTAAAAARLLTSNGAGGEEQEPEGKALRLRDIRLQKHQHSAGNIALDGILVVEDNLINQQITRRGLLDRGYTVDVANHGIEAQEKLRRQQGSVGGATAKAQGQGQSQGNTLPKKGRGQSPQQPMAINMVLMDIEMPVQDGLTCTRQIRELEQSGQVFCASGGRIPIIAVTANARPEQVMEAKQAGCDDVLVKPYRIPELIEKMQVVVRRVRGMGPKPPLQSG